MFNKVARIMKTISLNLAEGLMFLQLCRLQSGNKGGHDTISIDAD